MRIQNEILDWNYYWEYLILHKKYWDSECSGDSTIYTIFISNIYEDK